MGNNMFAVITCVTTGTSTPYAFCVYHYVTNSDEDSYTLDHKFGNSWGNSNKPYMDLTGKYPQWKINHSSGYKIAVTVEIYGGQGGTHWSGSNDYSA